MHDSVVSSTDGRGHVFSSCLFPRYEFRDPWGRRTVPAPPLTALSSSTLQPTTCVSSPSVHTCARRSTPCAAAHTCWRAPCPPSCRPSTWPRGSPCPAPGSAPTRWLGERSEWVLGPRAAHLASGGPPLSPPLCLTPCACWVLLPSL